MHINSTLINGLLCTSRDKNASLAQAAKARQAQPPRVKKCIICTVVYFFANAIITYEYVLVCINGTATVVPRK